MSPIALERSYLDTLADRCSGWYLNLPPERCSYTSQSLKIPMRDNTHLAADLFLPLPQSSPSRPLILVQTCYGRSKAMSIFNAHIYAARSYPVLFVSSRGTFGSEGVFDPGRNEARDGADVVGWMRGQAWYPGTFVTAGASYLGYASWALLRDGPPGEDCVGAVIPAAFHDMARHSWGTGALLMQRVEWSETIVRQEDEFPGLVGLAWARLAGRGEFRKVLEGVPLLDGVLGYFGGRAPWLEEWLLRPDVEDSYWEDMRHDGALERVDVTVPVLLVMGWYDLFTRRGQTLEGYQRLRERGCRVSLTIGPWGHVDASGLKSTPDILEFLDEHVQNTPTDVLPVKVYVTGRDDWRRMASWPPTTTARIFYLQENESLGLDTPPSNASPGSFTYDPADPTPTVDAGKEFQDHLTNRTDVLTYNTSPLEADLEVLGSPSIQLNHSSDIPFVDLSVRLTEVDPITGISRLIAETYQALDPTRDAKPVQLRLSDCAHVFRKGTCVQLMVAGASFPMFARSLGFEGNRTTGSQMRPVRHTVAVAGGASRLTLPVTMHDA